MAEHVYVERADPESAGYEEGTRRYKNVVNRYKWANNYVHGITIDMPTGMGWGASYITNADRLIGIDKSPHAIEKARRLYSGIEFEVGDMLWTSFDSGFADAVICCEGYEHVARRDQFLLMEEIHRILKPGGVAILTVPISDNKGDHTGNEFHLYEPTLTEVQDTLGNFKVVEYEKPNVARYVLEAIK